MLVGLTQETVIFLTGVILTAFSLSLAYMLEKVNIGVRELWATQGGEGSLSGQGRALQAGPISLPPLGTGQPGCTRAAPALGIRHCCGDGWDIDPRG